MGSEGGEGEKKAEIRNGIYVSTVRSTVEDCYKTFVIILWSYVVMVINFLVIWERPNYKVVLSDGS